MIKITLPDNTVKEYESGITGLDIAKSISEGLARNVLSVTVNGDVRDVTRPITEDARIK
ncbi:MAG: TGS domain-containing protein, partial [Bacteroidales bacterium]|nr:TGS domain-containing protein [Bacteroidales bacterium]